MAITLFSYIHRPLSSFTWPASSAPQPPWAFELVTSRVQSYLGSGKLRYPEWLTSSQLYLSILWVIQVTILIPGRKGSPAHSWLSSLPTGWHVLRKCNIRTNITRTVDVSQKNQPIKHSKTNTEFLRAHPCFVLLPSDSSFCVHR